MMSDDIDPCAKIPACPNEAPESGKPTGPVKGIQETAEEMLRNSQELSTLVTEVAHAGSLEDFGRGRDLLRKVRDAAKTSTDPNLTAGKLLRALIERDQAGNNVH